MEGRTKWQWVGPSNRGPSNGGYSPTMEGRDQQWRLGLNEQSQMALRLSFLFSQLHCTIYKPLENINTYNSVFFCYEKSSPESPAA